MLQYEQCEEEENVFETYHPSSEEYDSDADPPFGISARCKKFLVLVRNARNFFVGVTLLKKQ